MTPASTIARLTAFAAQPHEDRVMAIVEDGSLLTEILAMAQQSIALQERLVRHTDWYQQRFNRLRKWVKEEVEPLSSEVAHRYFSICANGSPCPHESADWTDTMHSMRLRLEASERQVAHWRKCFEESQPSAMGWYETTQKGGE